MQIGAVIKKFRTKKGITVEGLSIRCSIARSHLYYIESGRTSPTVHTLEKIASAMDIKIWEFFKDNE